jgi:hypothetical protein
MARRSARRQRAAGKYIERLERGDELRPEHRADLAQILREYLGEAGRPPKLHHDKAEDVLWCASIAGHVKNRLEADRAAGRATNKTKAIGDVAAEIGCDEQDVRRAVFRKP